MTKSLPASKKLMQNYLSELLTEEVTEPQSAPQSETKEMQKLEKLLQKVSVTEHHDEKADDAIVSRKSLQKTIAPVLSTQTVSQSENQHTEIVEPKLETQKSKGDILVEVDKDYRKASFQAMFFDVAGLIIAVPLVELGGIHNVDSTTSLLGKPSWFKGVMVHRQENINVVDTAQWVMPEKCNDSLMESLDYQYVIMLSDSSWGLMAEHLVDTVTLEPEDVKWLDTPSKRPWLAGLVKERMCALLDVEQLIRLLNDGMSIEQI